ncbi:hypothetical protein DFH27DRAFT_533790 [Peziza echinospora]|nr:hypothetical protein DFH27DRAFT_533790 [Peziza echinospora]
MSASAKFMLAVFYLACFMALFAPVALAHGNETHGNTTTNGTTGGKNGTNGTGEIPGSGASSSAMSSSIALFGALVAVCCSSLYF